MAENVNLNLLEKTLDPNSIFDYSVGLQQRKYFWESLFPVKEIEGSKYEFQQQDDTIVTMARFHALNSETDLDSRIGQEVSYGTLGYVKRERVLDEDDLLTLAQPVTNTAYKNALLSAYDDGNAMITACKEKFEAVRAQVATTGKLVVEDENGFSCDYDFGVPDENRKTFNWAGNAKADILKDIMQVCDEIENNGQNTRPAYMVVSSKTIAMLLENEKLRSAMFGVNSAIMPTQATLNAQLQSWGLPQIVRYNEYGMFPTPDNSGAVKKRLMDEDAIIMLPQGPIGNLILGTTPEEVNKRLQGVEVTKRNGIVLQVIPGHDTESQVIKASARFFVSLSRPKQIVIGKITS